MVYKVDADYDCGFWLDESQALKEKEKKETKKTQRKRKQKSAKRDSPFFFSPPTPPKPKRRKCKVHSGFKFDWLSVRDKVRSVYMTRR